MRVVYSDETGVGDIATEPNVVVAAVIIHGDFQVPPLYDDVRAIKEEFLKGMQPIERELYEFKGGKLFGQIDRPGRKRDAARLCWTAYQIRSSCVRRRYGQNRL